MTASPSSTSGAWLLIFVLILPWLVRRRRALLALVFLVAGTQAARAQQLDLPRPSPNAKLVQTVGLTDITVDYSSPAVKGRKIWGGVVPWNEVWRAGANAATKVTFSKDVTFAGTPVPAGSYAFFVIPKDKSTWTVILSKEANQPGSAAYKKEQDLMRAEVKPQTVPNRERLAYQIVDFNNDGGTLALDWEKVRLPIPFKLNTEQQVASSLKGLEENGQAPYTSAARYELEQKKDYDAGLKFVDQSMKIKEDWLNNWTKAQLLAAKGQYKQALPLAQRAQELGTQAPPGRFFFADEVKKSISEWTPKAK